MIPICLFGRSKTTVITETVFPVNSSFHVFCGRTLATLFATFLFLSFFLSHIDQLLLVPFLLFSLSFCSCSFKQISIISCSAFCFSHKTVKSLTLSLSLSIYFFQFKLFSIFDNFHTRKTTISKPYSRFRFRRKIYVQFALVAFILEYHFINSILWSYLHLGFRRTS